MRLLLDTHVFLWLNDDPRRVGDHLDLLHDPATERLLSAASVWELAIKVGLGKLQIPEPVDTWVPSRVRATATSPIAVEHDHAVRVASLPDHHRDPFDRLLIAQAQALGVPILTADRAFGRYDVEVLSIG